MLAAVRSATLIGVDGQPVTVEVHLGNGLPNFTIVGLPEAEVKEAKERVRAVLQNARFEFPARRITVNLAPAALPKESGRFDLPIALGILVASEQVVQPPFESCELYGELSLGGEIRPVRGALLAAIAAGRAGHRMIVPPNNIAETLLVSVGIEDSSWLQRTRPEFPTMSMRGMPAPLTM